MHGLAARELAPAGETHAEQILPFEFNNVDASMDSYRGHTVRLRYVLKVTVSKSVGGFSQEFPLWVQNPCKSLPAEEPIKVSMLSWPVIQAATVAAHGQSSGSVVYQSA